MKSSTKANNPTSKPRPRPEFTLLELMEEMAGKAPPGEYTFLTVREMAVAVGRSKSAIREHLDRLELMGYQIIVGEKDYVNRAGNVQPVPAYAVIGKKEEGEEG